MKITDVQTILLTGPCTNDPWLSEARKSRSAAFVEITTDSGLKGLGETYAGYFCPEIVPHVVESFKPILVNQTLDPDKDLAPQIENQWRRMYYCENFWARVGLGTNVLTAIESAMWDLMGKARRQPVHALLAQKSHERLPCYATGGPSNYPKDRLSEKTDFYLSLGFNGLKIGAGAHDRDTGWYMPSERNAIVEFERDKIAFLRNHVGRDVKILLDGHMGNSPGETWDLETAKGVLDAMEPFDIFFYEEPLPYTNPYAYAELAEHAKVPVAGGECLTAPCEWLPYINTNSFDIAQPDASWVGGLLCFLEIAKLFERRGKRIATHAWGAGGSMMQNIHAGFAAPNTAILEIAPAFGPLHREIIGDSFVMKGGLILPPQTPGLGIRVTDEIRKRFPFIPGSGEFNPTEGKSTLM